MDATTVEDRINQLLPDSLWRMRRASGVPVVFGGHTTGASGGRQLLLNRLVGTLGDSLRGLTVHRGRGLGGAVLRDRTVHRVNDYAASTAITHDYDPLVVGQEQLTSVFAVPVTVDGAVRAVMYGAVRTDSPIGDRALAAATAVAEQLARDAQDRPRSEAPDLPACDAQAPLHELAEVIRDVTDPETRERLARICRALGGPGLRPPTKTTLAPRERDVLRIAAVGATNVEIAAQLGLSPQTVKAYLRTAMRRLGVHNRTAALHAARQAGVL